ncbi:MAG: hypothetical protein M1819_002759 [Sarea resinae]|nr:MAG: hypothetical protein M1819_002759 [Sarea resinae]
MSGNDDVENESSRRTNNAPYTARHPIPNIQRYQEQRQQRKDQEVGGDVSGQVDDEQSYRQQATQSVKNYWYSGPQDQDGVKGQDGSQQPYQPENRNDPGPKPNRDDEDRGQGQGQDQERQDQGQDQERHDQEENDKGNTRQAKDTSQAVSSEVDPKKKRKDLKGRNRDRAEREVTDPVTHLQVVIHDSTKAELKNVPENLPPAGSQPNTATGSSGSEKSQKQLDEEGQQQQDAHSGMEKLFPTPNLEQAKVELIRLYRFAFGLGLGLVVAVIVGILGIQYLFGGFWRSNNSNSGSVSWVLGSSALAIASGLVGGIVVIKGMQGWVENKVQNIWDDEVWEGNRHDSITDSDAPIPESVQWLNSLVTSIWPLVNPDLFTGLADTLEDVMQASLPRMVRMISVEDLGQGSEAIRILGVRWLPTAAASKAVSAQGKLQSGKNKDSDRKVEGEGEVDHSDGDDDNQQMSSQDQGQGKQDGDGKGGDDRDQNVAEGMEAEDGDFVNVEIAFAYRARSAGRSLRTKAKNAHIFLAFYLPGNLRFPIWVELRGMVGTIRLRLQLTPDPPFFALCTMTFLGQPKVDLSCVPLTKHGLNIMDVPLISGFVQSSVDAAMAEYVAPKSLTLDLKDMLVGDDFKKDTNTRGVIVVRIIRSSAFKEGDPGFAGLKKGSSDPYVSVGWAKFGKPVWSTRVIVSEMEPSWDETCFVLVGPEELNAKERLRLQLWDSDRSTADDDLGRIEVDLKEIMTSKHSNGRMWAREDGFLALEGDETMPGTLHWEVGYYSKTRLQPCQFEKQTEAPDIKNMDQLKSFVSKEAETKLREATTKDESFELDQQKAQGLKAREDRMIVTSPPPDDYPSGIFSIQIHQITGLEFEKIKKNKGKADDDNDNDIPSDGDLPDSYCTVILNHQKIFKTRTKPKNSQPFFNAGTERFVRDWKSAEVILAVSDSRVHEEDPLLGVVTISLGHAFKERSQVNDFFPLAGGIGYGRARISMVWRSVQLQAPKELLGWDYGTIEVTAPIKAIKLPDNLQGLRLKLHTPAGKCKMHSSDEGWTGKHGRPVRLAVRRRYRACIVFEFRRNAPGPDTTPAFAIFWLKDIPDNEQRTVTLSVWKKNSNVLKRAETNCIAEEEFGDTEKLGEISVPLKFWPGLGDYHKRLASRDQNIKDVWEVLACADGHEDDNNGDDESGSEDDGDDDDDSDDSHDNENGKRDGVDGDGGVGKGSKANNDGDEDVSRKRDNSLSSSGHRGVIDQIKDYRQHREQLHRHHRGAMQWRGPRTLHWAKVRAEHMGNAVSSKFRHRERDPGIETEI